MPLCVSLSLVQRVCACACNGAVNGGGCKRAFLVYDVPAENYRYCRSLDITAVTSPRSWFQVRVDIPAVSALLVSCIFDISRATLSNDYTM